MPPSPNPVTIVVVGAGSRGTTYAHFALENPDLAKVIAVTEPARHRRAVFSRNHGIPQDLQFQSWKHLCARGKIADAVVIAVLDHQHVEAVDDFVHLGYHVLCEKPMATSVSDCIKIRNLVCTAGLSKVFAIGHVRQVIDSGALGHIINIQHIEPVGNQHFAHSFVRGNWHKEATSSFSLMTKSCQPRKVHSFGSLTHFQKSRKPVEAGSATRCLDCRHEENCVWSAKKIYIDTLQGDEEKWARHFVDAEVLDVENVTEALERSNYGTCVYEGDNDVVDHQVVNIEYDGGVTASITMSAFTESVCQRATRIHGTKGELIGDMTTFDVFDFLTRTRQHYAPKVQAGGGPHGGGDTGLAAAFVAAVANADQVILGVTVDDVLDSHLLVFAAEKARREGCVVDFAKFRQEAD